jgi:hypothetical protein
MTTPYAGRRVPAGRTSEAGRPEFVGDHGGQWLTMSDRFSEDTQDELDADGDHLVETPETLRDDDLESAFDRGSGASDRPFGAEKFGTTHAEAEEGESLDQRLAEEVPETGAHDPVEDIVADDPATFGGSDEQTDEQVLDDAYGDPEALDLDVDREAVGRLVEPDEGAHPDTEKDEVATDVGRDGGDVSAEEAALHLEEER